MKVSGTGGVSQAGGPRGARGPSGEGFRLPDAAAAEGPVQTANVASTGAVVSVDALIALQDVGGPLERRRRAVNRAGRILDVLEGIKIALLEGRITGADLERLQRAVRESRSATEDPQLEALLDEIETRATVELAKLEVAKLASRAA